MLKVILRAGFKQGYSLSRHPRRARRGFSLFETILVVLILGFATQWIIAFVTREAHLKAARAESVQVSELARAAEAYLRRDLGNTMTEVANLPTRVRQVTLEQLRDAGVIMNGQTTFTALRRDATIWAYAPSSNELYVLARATGGDGAPPNIPTAQPGVTNIGWVSPTSPTRVTGPELSWDVSSLQGLVGWPVAEDLLAVIYLNSDRDLRPYLHRSAVSGRPELNQMMTDIDMGGFNLSNVNNLSVRDLTATTSADLGSVTVTGALSTNSLNVAGGLTVANQLTANSAQVTGAVTASTGTITSVTAGDLNITGTLSAQSGSIDTLTGRTLESTGTLDARNIQSTAVTTQDLQTNTISTNQATVGGTVSATTGQFNTLQTNGCTGC